jgi:hypothetical protein
VDHDALPDIPDVKSFKIPLQVFIVAAAAVLPNQRAYTSRTGEKDDDQRAVTFSGSRRQLVEQVLGFFQIERVEAFGEPTIDRSEKIAGFGDFTLGSPLAGEIAGGTQFERARLLRPCHLKRFHVAGFGLGQAVLGRQQMRAPPLSVRQVSRSLSS